MLIEALARLAERAGAERITLTISATDGGECDVMVVPCMGQGMTTAEDQEMGRILAALSEPMVVQGNAGELDGKLVRAIDEVEADVVTASLRLPETNVQKRRRELREAAKGKADGKGGEKDAAEATDGDSGSVAEALAAGEADSL